MMRDRRRNPKFVALAFVGVVVACAVFTLAFAASFSPNKQQANANAAPAAATTAPILADASYTSGDYAAAARYIEQCRNRPRYSYFTSDYTLTRQPNALCAPSTGNSSDFGDCQWGRYAESLVLVPAPAFIIAAIAFPVMFVAFWAFRCCCWGTCRTTPSLCCGSHNEWDPTVHGYTPKQVRNLKIAVVVVTVGVTVVMVMGLIGTSLMNEAISGLVELVTGTADRVMEVLTRVAGRFAAMDSSDPDVFQEDINPPLQAALEQGTTFSEIIGTAEGIINRVETGRMSFMYINLMLPFVLCVCALLAAFFGWYALCWPLAILGFICICVSWITFGIHFPIGTGLADVCYFIDQGLLASNPQTSAAYNYLFSCSNDSGIGGLNQLALDGINNAYDDVCEIFRRGCNQTLPCDANGDGNYTLGETCAVLDCGGNDPATCGPATFSSWQKTTINNIFMGCAQADGVIMSPCPYNPADPNEPNCPAGTFEIVCNGATAEALTLQECASTCANDFLRYAAAELRDKYAQISEFTSILTFDILPLVNCQTMSDLFTSTKDFVCVTIMRALELITVAEGILGALLIAATVIGILGIKRFNKNNWLKEAIQQEATVGAAMVPIQHQPQPSSANIVVIMQQPGATPAQAPPPPQQQMVGGGGGESYSSYSSYSTVSGDTRRNPEQAQAIVASTLAEVQRQPEVPAAYDFGAVQQQLAQQQQREDEAALLAAAELERQRQAEEVPPPYQPPFEQPTMETLRPEEEPEEMH